MQALNKAHNFIVIVTRERKTSVGRRIAIKRENLKRHEEFMTERTESFSAFETVRKQIENSGESFSLTNDQHFLALAEELRKRRISLHEDDIRRLEKIRQRNNQPLRDQEPMLS